ncbi:MAG: hypothetical protein EP329_19110 [Deltaproteobacteria bacterium]|nr:MAG: hypothetical protein EP329_19110 [Deltaproteobacteria bacterium]
MSCPRCGDRGRVVTDVTLRAQVSAPRLAALDALDAWRRCLGAGCDVAYFRGAEIIDRADVPALARHADDDPERLVCFCFEHTAAALTAPGGAALRAAIADACRDGQDACEQKNPKGRCCLGDVDALLRAAAPPALVISAPSGGCSCCCGDD